MRLVTAEEMRQADAAATNDYGIPSVILMENAGLAVVKEVVNLLGTLDGKKAVIFCGGGNNGGDGLVVARHLHNAGCEVRLYFLADPDIFRGDALLNLQILKNMGVNGYWITEGSRLNIARMALWSSDIVIDAIFGTGLRDEVSSTILSVINIINESHTPVIACDIPSGLSSVTGMPLGAAVEATSTVTFGFCKLGLIMPEAKPYVGKLIVADISLPTQVEENLDSRRELLDAKFCRRWLTIRNRKSHKGDYGHVLEIAGSPNMPGAAILAATGVMKTGAGLLTAAIPSACRTSFTARLPEAMLLPLSENSDGLLSSSTTDEIAKFDADCYLVGPGMGRNPETISLIHGLLKHLNKPTVLDADGLFAVCGNLWLLKNFQAPMVVTPHPGEMANLLGISPAEVQENRIEIACKFAAENDVIVVLKGAGTVVATPEGRLFINNTGNPGMATAGSGDVLSGMIASLLAQGLPPAAAAACAVWLHGRAGDIAAAASSEAGITASDIAVSIPLAYTEVI